MDLRSLSFFLAAAEAKSIKKAALKLHKTQPNVTRTIHDLEEELGIKLFSRNSRGILLTEEGVFLRARAEEILNLVKKTGEELESLNSSELTGRIVISAGESEGMRNVIKMLAAFKKLHPKVEFSIRSGNGEFVSREIESGLADLGVVFEPFELSAFRSLELPWTEEWAVIMRRDDPLAKHLRISPEMLHERPLLLSEQTRLPANFWNWMKKKPEELNVLAYYSLVNTPKLMVEEGFGLMLTFNRLLDLNPSGPLVVRSLFPALTAKTFIIWKKDKPLSKPAEAFLKYMNEHVGKAEAQNKKL